MNDASDGTPTLPFALPRPKTEPEITWVNRSRNASGWTTALARKHAPGAGYCGLCPLSECNLLESFCLVTHPGYVSDESAPLFSTVLGRALTLSEYLGLAPDHGAQRGADEPG